jgi:hypothetical protein
VRPYVQTPLLKKKKRDLARNWWLTPVILATWEAEIRMIKVRGQHGQTGNLQKTSTAKWNGGMAQAAEYPLCKHKALSSNLSHKNKIKQKVQIIC